MVDGTTIARGIEVTVDGSRQGSASSRNVKFTPADIFEGHTKSLSFLGCMDREKMQFLWNLSNLRMREAVRCLAATAASITIQKAPVCSAVHQSQGSLFCLGIQYPSRIWSFFLAIMFQNPKVRVKGNCNVNFLLVPNWKIINDQWLTLKIGKIRNKLRNFKVFRRIF